ncbi:enoyl-CoA hydratase/carnithine racemase [Polaromonas sp. CG_9.7]|nr:enoyl-CoA hydratase/carnithine racemase [Polaromonas sp. CG_9.7]MBG6112417.1 enoyl-CoA hydratase/carnithine racemase [Polaromonas sp. CG_9.2]MDH6184064.1 enoyl-CoA hydratase/carnithine racemase [Polaromonas sp. CG_23.6]
MADVGTLQRLPKLLPLAVVKELACTGRKMGAAKALGHGLGNEVLDTPQALLAGALQCAKEIAAKPPVALWGTKQAVHYARDHSVDNALNQMGWLQGAIWSHQQVHQAVTAVTAMKEKRAGNFPDLAVLQYFNEIGL